MKRIDLIDNLKGYAILLVILGHSIQTYYVDSFDDNVIFRFIYSFHMPFFMFLAGYVANKNPDVNKIKQLFTRLVIPFFIWGIFSYILKLGYWSDHRNFFELFWHPDVGLWFLYILFLINLFYFIVYKLYNYKRILGGLLVIPVYLMFCSLVLFSVECKYFILGMTCYFIFEKYKIYRKIQLQYVGLFLMSLAFVIMMPYWYRNHSVSINFVEQYHLNGTYKFIVAVCGMAVSLLLVRILTVNNFVKSVLGFFGKKSLEFYVVHQYLFEVFKYITVNLVVFRMVIVILMSWVIILLINTNVYTRRFCFGVSK